MGTKLWPIYRVVKEMTPRKWARIQDQVFHFLVMGCIEAGPCRLASRPKAIWGVIFFLDTFWTLACGPL